jgi:hypothetical protein
MALHADFQLAVAVEPCGIDDGSANLLAALPCRDRRDVRAAWTMTALAIDP